MYVNDNIVKRSIETKPNEHNIIKGYRAMQSKRRQSFEVNILWNIAMKVLKEHDSDT